MCGLYNLISFVYRWRFPKRGRSARARYGVSVPRRATLDAGAPCRARPRLAAHPLTHTQRPRLHNHHHWSSLRQRPRHHICPQTQKTSRPDELLRRQSSCSWHARRIMRDDLQRKRGTDWLLAIWPFSLWYLQLPRCLLLQCVNTSPLLHIRW